jgi:hypothetical protein
MRDFTLEIYRKLILSLQSQQYTFQTFSAFLEQPELKSLILRHDVDARKENSLRFARIQKSMDISGTYYFRVGPQSFDSAIIKKIATMGHEIGYHYETMDTCSGNIDQAWDEFRRNLDMFRSIVPITTICMHGSPRSKHDNRTLWEKYDYRQLDIIGEPYFDIDFNKVFYLTDTGRRWNGNKVSIRDKVEIPDHFKHYTFVNSQDIIDAVIQKELPDKIMFTFHPQRWTDNPLEWSSEYITQNLKNLVKKYLFVK